MAMSNTVLGSSVITVADIVDTPMVTKMGDIRAIYMLIVTSMEKFYFVTFWDS